MGFGDTAVRLGVALADEVPPPIGDPTLGVPVQSRTTLAAPSHRLVTIGDSLTEGFQHVATADPKWSWPAIVARELGVELVRPHDSSPLGGTPLNLERLTRRLGRHVLPNLARVYGFAREVDHHYVTGPGSQWPDADGPVNENVAVWRWDLRDTLERTADTEKARLDPPVPGPVPRLPGNAWAAVQVLNSARRDGVALTPLQAARRLGEDPGGIETLCVWLGANNILGTVVDLEVHPSGPGFDTVVGKQKMNAWTAEHFTVELHRVATEVQAIDAAHVLWGTIPHVTIPPVTRGLGGPLPECARYFRWYGRPWQDDDTFDPGVDKHLTGEQAWAIDAVIDAYNRAVVEVVRTARQQGRDWQLVDLCSLLDRLAIRRNVENAAAPGWVAELPDPRPAPLRDLTTEFFGSDVEGRRTRGGLFALGGVHPSTCGYGIVAQTFLDAVRRATGQPAAMIDFAALRAHDTLVSDPPPDLDGLLARIRRFDHTIDPLQRLLRRTGVLPI